MENEVDDQGSGWLEVKKKHRGNSKFFLQSWVGGFSARSASSSQVSQSQLYDASGNLINKRRVQPSKAGGNPSGHGQRIVANSITASSKVKVMCCDEKCMVEQDSVCEPSPSVPPSKSNDKTGDILKHSEDEKHKVLPKIKWGDLDDDSLAQHHGVGVEIKFGNIGDVNVLTCEEFREKNNGGSSTPKYERSEPFNTSETPADTVKSHQMFPSSSSDKKEPDDVQIVKEKIINPTDDALEYAEVCNEHVNTVYRYHRSSSALGEEDGAVVKLPVFSEVKDLRISTVMDTDDSSLARVTSEDSTVVLPINDKCEDSEATEMASIKYFSNQQGSMIDDGMAKLQNLNASEDDSSESKERFRQRLWCFLFENLNRAVDELYLLCELECDLEQMKEAILVLEEAALDFKELASRVEKFENVKKPTSLSVDGVPIALKTDHRRPHALSWEVRRMTTSPHRAEILSSSIEAFRKIQQQRLSIYLADDKSMLLSDGSNCQHIPVDNIGFNGKTVATSSAKDPSIKLRKQSRSLEVNHGNLNGEKQTVVSCRPSKANMGQNSCAVAHHMHPAEANSGVSHSKDGIASSVARKSTRELGLEGAKLISRKEKTSTESSVEKHPKHMDHLKRQPPFPEKDKQKRTSNPWKTMDAWKEKRNWEDILSSPFRVSSRISHSPGMSRKSAERARTLHDKLMSPEKKKKNAWDLKREAEEKHARAMRIRSELEQERMLKLQRTSEKLTRVNEWQAVRHMKLREGMYARHQRGESRHEAYLARVARRAGDESSKVNEVRFITSLNEENKKFMLRQKLQDSEMRRAEKLQVMKTKQKEDLAREEAVLGRRKLIEAEKLQRLAETQRKKEEAQVRREEERRASSAAREARAMEQLRRKEVRAKAQQEEAELLAQKLAEKLSESEQRRKFYLEQIKERASMDFRDQSSPLLRRSTNKEAQGRITPTKSCEDSHSTCVLIAGCSSIVPCNAAMQQSMKRRIKRIRQKLMALKYEFSEPPLGSENTSIGYRTSLGTARAKIGRWIQDLQKLRQARKEGASSIGMIIREMIKFVEGKDLELHASRQSGLIDFIASALPASHTSKPEACQVTIHLLKLLKVVLAVPANRSYFLAQNLLPPVIPMLSAALENYIKIAASLNVPGSTNTVSSKTSIENFESISEVLDGFLWTVTAIISHITSDDRQLQMRESLLELLIAYQVIHRLRDLFALYDRPQVEGSPFPSSIVLSIHLLVVLTSRPEMDNNINWEFKPSETHLSSKIQDAKLADSGHSVNAVLDDSSVDQKSSLLEGEVALSLPVELEDTEIDDLRVKRKCHESISREGDDKNAFALQDAAEPNISRNRPDQAGEITTENNIRPCEDIKHSKDLLDDAGEQKDENTTSLKKPLALLLSAISETGLVCLPSLLTSVLLQANNRLSLEQASYVLPSNFEEVATGVLKFLNNLAYLDITFMQKMLARLDLKMEFFHLMSFLLSHCNSKWGTPKDQVGLLLLESLLLLGHFALFHPKNQAVLRWGNSPTILHKVCDLPFVFFSDPELMPILAGTLVAACYGCEQNKGVIQQELSVDMLLSLLKSCRNALPPVQHPAVDNLLNDSNDQSLHSLESRKVQAEKSARLGRCNTRSSKTNLVKGTSAGNNMKTSKRKDKATKICEENSGNHYSLASRTSSVMLHCRFPSSFIDRAEEFFSAGMMGAEAEGFVEA